MSDAITASAPVTGTVTGTVARAAVVTEPGRVALQASPMREPGPGQVRVRLDGCGVCGSNLPVWEGRDWFSYPLEPGAPGHEGWGVIDALGDDVASLRVGDRVAVLSYHAFAEYDVADANAVVPLPAAIAGAPFPGEPLGCAMNVFLRAGIERGQTVAVVGIGFLGALLTQLCVNAGARVIAISRRDFALHIARSCGAQDAIRFSDVQGAVQQVERLTGGSLCDRVIECVGLQSALDLSAAITRTRGRLVVAGFHQDGPRTVDMQMWNWRGLDVINAHEREPRVYVEGIRAAVAAVAAGVLDPTSLYTHVLPLDRVDRALELMRHRPDGFLKALVTT